MKKMTLRTFMKVLLAGFLCSTMTGCESFQSQLTSCETDIHAHIRKHEWQSAARLIESAQFSLAQDEVDKARITDWRKDQRLILKKSFTEYLQTKALEVRKTYQQCAGNYLKEGDAQRLAVRDEFFAVKSPNAPEDERLLKLTPSSRASNPERGLPDMLVPCVDLVWVEMLSDRNLARMAVALAGYRAQVQSLDVNGGAATIKALDDIRVGYKKMCKWKDKVDLFMELLADSDTRRWTPVDRSTYALEIKKVEQTQAAFSNEYMVARWNANVVSRRRDYVKVAELMQKKDTVSAMQILGGHDWLLRPAEMRGGTAFEDQAERAAVCSKSGLGVAIVRQLVGSGMTGVQYHRRTPRGQYSLLVVGRAPVEDPTNKRQCRDAVKVAQLKARREFVEWLGATVVADAVSSVTLDDQGAREYFASSAKEIAQREVSNLVPVATGLEQDECVVVMGWRTPEAGTVTPVPQEKTSNDFLLSPSVGAYL